MSTSTESTQRKSERGEHDSDDLLEVARATGLRQHIHGVNATAARLILQRFVGALRFLRADGDARTAGATGPESFQARVRPWLMQCFGPMIAGDSEERNHRFFEEAAELVQSRGMSRSEAHQLVDYVFNRPVGEPIQEAGGVMVTLAALCLAAGIDMHDAGEVELTRIWGKVEQIRAKQAAKPKHSPLPEAPTPPTSAADAMDAHRWREVARRFDQAKTSEAESVLEALGVNGKATDPFPDLIDAAIAASKETT